MGDSGITIIVAADPAARVDAAGQPEWFPR
jgi:hypothetical protein